MSKFGRFAALLAVMVGFILVVSQVNRVSAGPVQSGPAQSGPSLALQSISQVAKLVASDGQKDDFYGTSVAISGSTLVVGAQLEDGGSCLACVNQGAAYIYEPAGPNGAWVEVTKILASDGEQHDYFGFSVAISGNTLVVGASGEDGGQTNPEQSAGAAYVFERDQGGADNWGQVAKLSADDAQAIDRFGISVDIGGDTIVIGADGDAGPDNSRPYAGAAYVFYRNIGGPNNWGQVKKLTANDAQEEESFGSAVSVSGDTLTVGARRESGGSGESGAAYVFYRDIGGPDNWGQFKKLKANDAQGLDFFGSSISISRDTIVVGAIGKDGVTGDNNLGAAYVFERDMGGAGGWGQAKKLTASDAQEDDLFGVSVSVSRDTIVAGAYWEGGGPGDPDPAGGAAYVFHRHQGGQGNWGEMEKILPNGGASIGDEFGSSVSIDGLALAVGAPRVDGGFAIPPFSDVGAAYLFSLPSGLVNFLPIVNR